MNTANKCLIVDPMMTLNVILQLVDAIMSTLVNIAIKLAAVDAMEKVNVVLFLVNALILCRILLPHHSQMVHTIEGCVKQKLLFYLLAFF